MEIGSDSHRATCTSLFLEDPPKWLRAEESSESTGKLHCPHCKSRCGSFNWAGSQCSCENETGFSAFIVTICVCGNRRFVGHTCFPGVGESCR